MNFIFAFELKEVDMCISFSPPSITKKNLMDTSISVFDDDISIMMPYPTRQDDGIKALLAPFHTEVISFSFNFIFFIL